MKFKLFTLILMFCMMFLAGCTIDNNDAITGNVITSIDNSAISDFENTTTTDSNAESNDVSNVVSNDENLNSKDSNTQVSTNSKTISSATSFSGSSGGGGSKAKKTESEEFSNPVPINIINPIVPSDESNNYFSSEKIKKIDEINKKIIDETVTEELLIERKELMKELIDKNIRQFYERSKVTLDIEQKDFDSSNIEQQISLEGYLNILMSDDESGSSHYSYSILSNNKMYKLYPTQNLFQLNPSLRSGSKIKLDGIVLDDIIAAQTSDIQILLNGPLNTVGEQKIAVFLVNFTDSQNPNPENMTPSWVKNRLENGPFAKFMYEQSYGKVGPITADVFGWYEIPHPISSSGGNCFWPSPTEINDYANSLGLNMSDYERVLIVVNHQAFPSNCATEGTSYVGTSIINVGNGQQWNTSISWVGNVNINNQSTYLTALGQPFNWTRFDYLVSHELGGHGFGANHAAAMKCEPGVVSYGTQCIENNPYFNTGFYYGNFYDIMGTVFHTLHTNAYFKDYYGWIDQDNIQSITEDGIYTINPLESSEGIHAAKIYPKGSDPNNTTAYAYVEIRRPIGYDSKMNYSTGGWPNTKGNLNGIFVNILNEFTSDSENFPRTFLLDMTPNSYGGNSPGSYNDMLNVTLNVNKTYEDVIGIQLKTLSVTDDSATFEVNLTQPSCFVRDPIVLNSETSSQAMSMHRPVQNIFQFGRTLQGRAYSGCKESTISVKPNYPSSWRIEQYEKLSTGEYVPIIDGLITLNETSSKNIVTYAFIPRSFLQGKTYSWAPTYNFTIEDFGITYTRLILDKNSNMSFGNDSCITRPPIFIGDLNYNVNLEENFMMKVVMKNNDSQQCPSIGVSFFDHNVTFPEGWTATPYEINIYYVNKTFVNSTTGLPYTKMVLESRYDRFYDKYVRINSGISYNQTIYYNITPPKGTLPGTYNVSVNFTNLNGMMTTKRTIAVNIIDPCVRNTPTIQISSETLLREGIDNNTLLHFNVTNNDNSYCKDAMFNITTTNPYNYELLEIKGLTYVPVDMNTLNISAGVKKRFAYNITFSEHINTTFSITAKNNDSELSATEIHSMKFYDPCVKINPTITFAGVPFNFVDTISGVTNGTVVATIKNNDNNYCTSRTFTTTIEGHSTWDYLFTTPIIVSGGETINSNISFVAKENNLSGKYDFNISIADSTITQKSTVLVTATVSPKYDSDLMIEGIYLTNSTPKIGQTVGLKFVITSNNLSVTSLTNFDYTINTGEAIISRHVDEIPIPFEMWEDLTYSTTGPFNGIITLDSSNNYNEENELNNIGNFNINIQNINVPHLEVQE